MSGITVTYKKLSYCRQAARCYMSLNVSLSHSRSLETAPFDRSHTSSPWRSVVTMALPFIISEIKRDTVLIENRDFLIPPLHSNPLLGGRRRNITGHVWCRPTETRVVELSDSEKVRECLALSTQYRGVADRQTNWQTSCHGIMRAYVEHRAVKMLGNTEHREVQLSNAT